MGQCSESAAVNEGDELPAERRDALYAEVVALRRELKDHISEEMPAIRSMTQELGTLEQIRERRIFIEILIVRERMRMKLKTAIIEKGLLLALVALVVFIMQATWHELVAVAKMMSGK